MLDRGSRDLPAADADLDQVSRGDVRDVGGVKVRGGVHALVQVFLLDVRVPIDVDDADLLGSARGDAADGGEADGVVAAEDEREGTGGEDVADRVGDLIEGFLDVGGDGEHVARVTHRHLLAEIDAHLVVVRGVQSRDASDALGTEPGAGPVRAPAVEGYAEAGDVVVAHVPHVLLEGSLEEGVDAGEVRKLAAAERGDGLVLEGGRAGQADLDVALELGVVHGRRDRRVLDRGFPALGLEPRVRRVGVVMPGLPLQVRARSGEATRGGVVANPGENLPRDLLLLGLLKRRVGGAPAIRRVLGGRFDQSSRHDRGRRASAASCESLPRCYRGGKSNEPPPRVADRRDARIDATRGEGT